MVGEREVMKCKRCSAEQPTLGNFYKIPYQELKRGESLEYCEACLPCEFGQMLNILMAYEAALKAATLEEARSLGFDCTRENDDKCSNCIPSRSCHDVVQLNYLESTKVYDIRIIKRFTESFKKYLKG